MIEQWYYAREKQKVGPLSATQLAELVHSGQLQPTDMVHKEGTKGWMPISQVPELRAAPAPPKPEPPAPPPPESNAAPRRSWWKVPGAEVVATVGAGVGMTVRLAHLLAGLWPLWRARRAATSAALTLAEKMTEAGVGEAALRTQAAALTDQLAGKWPFTHETRSKRAELHELLQQLARHALAQDILPGLEAEWHIARQKQAERQAKEERYQAARGALAPSDGAGWLRVGIGYGLLAVLFVALIVMVSNRGAARSQAIALEVDLKRAAFSPDLRTLAAPGREGGLVLYDLEKHGAPTACPGPKQDVVAVVFAPNGKMVATAAGSEIKLWDVTTRAEQRTVGGLPGPVLALAFAPDSQTLAVGLQNSTVRLLDPATGTEKATLPGYTRGPLAFSPDGKTLAAGGFSVGVNNEQVGIVKLYDVASAAEKATWKGHGSEVYSLAFSPDGDPLASGTLGTIRLWDVKAGKMRVEARHSQQQEVGVLAFSPDGKLLASGGDNLVAVWNVATGERQATLQGNKKDGQGLIRALAFSSDGSTLASASSNGTVVRWNSVDRLRDLNHAPRPEHPSNRSSAPEH